MDLKTKERERTIFARIHSISKNMKQNLPDVFEGKVLVNETVGSLFGLVMTDLVYRAELIHI